MQEATIATLVEPILAEHGLELDGLTVTPMGRRKVLRITVDGDGAEGRGPLLDEISAASRALSAALDGSEAVGNAAYTLEVSSRGTSAPLTESKHFRRNRGRLVKLHTSDGEVTGRIQESNEDSVVLDVEGKTEIIALGDVAKAVVQVELTKPKQEEN